MTTRKRRFKSLHISPTSYSQPSTSGIEPPLKRRRLSLGNLSPKNNHRQNYLTNNLIKLRNDVKISDVTFVVTKKALNPHNSKHSKHSNHNKNPSLSDEDEQPIANVRKFRCIKALFAANSEVFKNLLYGDFNEAQSLHPEIEIKDISCNAFEYIRDLFYHFNPVLTSDIVIDVAIAAHRYFIHELMSECINYLRNISNISKWYHIIYEIQNKYNNCFGIEQYLCALIDENYMVNNCTQIIFQDLHKLYALNIDILCRIIQSNNVYLSEEVIWHKCIGYSLYKTKQKLNNKIPNKIKLLIDAHLSIPKQIYEEIKNNDKHKKEREFILSQVIDLSCETGTSHYANNSIPIWCSTQKNNIKNLEKMIIKQRDIFIKRSNKNHRNNGDIIIDDDGEDEGEEEEEDMDENNEQDNDNDEKNTEEDNDKKFINMFDGLMHRLAENIRFTLMVPMFFIKLVQFSEILALTKVIEIQNYLLCKIKPEKCTNLDTFITVKREKKYLKYFTDIQQNKKTKVNINHNKSMRKHKFRNQLQISESEEQKRDGDNIINGDNDNDNYVSNMSENDTLITFFNDEMCFDGIGFDNLCIDDHIDHRDNVGRFATAVIVDIDKNRNKVKLHYIGWQSKWDLWCDISAKCQQIRFCCAGSISTRQIHRIEFKSKGRDLKDTVVKCRLAKYWYRNHPDVSPDVYDMNEWRLATIKRVDKHSGQTQLVVRIGQKDYLWWVHLDSFDEVQPYNPIDLIDRNSSNGTSGLTF